jgi:hypothetical protein
MKLYWTCSKVADWLRGTPKPHFGTAEEWNAWEKKAKLKKFRYWLADKGLDYLENFVCWPSNRINDVRCYIRNRWITKSHALTSNLTPGRWHDYDTRLLHSIFDELVSFVEIELACQFVVCSDDEGKKYKTPWYRIGSWRSPEAGIAYLEWASELKYDTDILSKDDPRLGQPTSQALAAQETFTLYRWWKQERPNRPDPSNASGWSEYCERKHKAAVVNGDNPLLSSFITNELEENHSNSLCSAYRKIEKEQEDEDTAMLIRLVKIRQSLWT